jgi:hypothetical protein
MKANNFNVERAWWSVLDGKHGKWQKIYASNGILEVADLLDKFSARICDRSTGSCNRRDKP